MITELELKHRLSNRYFASNYDLADHNYPTVLLTMVSKVMLDS